jgi:hypothetical protein
MDEFLIKKWRTQFFTVLDTPDTPISPIRLPYSSTTSMNPLGSCSSNGTSFSSSSSSNSSPESSASSRSSPPFLSPSPSSSPSSPSPYQPNELKRKFTQFNAILSPSPSSTSAIPKKLDFVSPVQKSKNGGKKMGSSPQSPHSAQLLKNDDIFETEIILKFDLIIRTTSRGTIEKKKKDECIKASDFQDLKAQLLELGKPFIKGLIIKGDKGEFEVKTRKITDPLPWEEYADHFTLRRRQHAENLSRYTRKKLVKDMNDDGSGEPLMVVICMFGSEILAGDYVKAMKRVEKSEHDSTDRSGAVCSTQRGDIANQLKVANVDRWTTLYSGNWSIWADALIDNRREISIEEGIKLPPPRDILKFFKRPTISDDIVQNGERIRDRTTAGLRVLAGVKEEIDELNRCIIRQYEDIDRMVKRLRRTVDTGEELLRTFLIEGNYVIEETEVSRKKLSEVKEQLDFEHQ